MHLQKFCLTFGVHIIWRCFFIFIQELFNGFSQNHYALYAKHGYNKLTIKLTRFLTRNTSITKTKTQVLRLAFLFVSS